MQAHRRACLLLTGFHPTDRIGAPTLFCRSSRGRLHDLMRGGMPARSKFGIPRVSSPLPGFLLKK
jgi:hypothetical protein